MRKYMLLPAFNEERALPLLLNAIQKSFAGSDFKVIVIDDGSTDKTSEVVRDFKDKIPVHLIHHEVNQGLGEALKTGLKYVNQVAAGEDIVITMDADNSQDPSFALKLTDEIEKGCDIVIASRYCPSGKQIGVNPMRRILSRAVNALLRILFPIKGIRDYTSGYRAYRLTVVRQGFENFGDRFIQRKGFACMPEILIKLSALGAKVAELPLILRYDLKKSKSKLRLLNISLDYLFLFFSLKNLLSKFRK